MQIARQLVPLLFVNPAIDHCQLVPVTREEETVTCHHQPGHRHDHVLLLAAGRRYVTETRHEVEGHGASDVFGRKAQLLQLPPGRLPGVPAPRLSSLLARGVPLENCLRERISSTFEKG